jgi:hypothetical protein
MVDIRSLISQIPMEPGYVPAPPEPDLSVIQRLMGLPQTLRAVGQNMAVGAASLPVGVYKGFGNPAAGEAAMSQFQQEYGYTPTNPAAQRQLQGLGEFLQQLETEYKIPPMISPSQLPSRAATAGSAMQLGRIGTRMTGQAQNLARDLVREIQTTPPTGAVTLAPPSIPKSDIGFYSQLEAAVQPLQNKGTGQQYLAQIQKSAGVKPEEIQWTGLDEFLKGKKSVTKQEVQDYLAANRVDVQEVRLGDSPFLEQAFNDRFARRGFSMVQTDDGPQFTQTDMTGRRQLTYGELPEDIQATIQNQIVPGTNFGKYTLPGGENYREILLTLPSSRPSIKNMSPAEYNAAVEAADRAGVQDFQTTHFDQPNILAHLRVNDRTVDGKKTLFVEEIQSDWHQAGRKKGYKISTDKWNELSNLYQKELTGPLSQKEIDRIAELEKLGEQTSRESVPDAPFKTSWHELSLKRAIQEAAEKGYDQIAFTTGKTQAERYDLSKQINSIAVPSILGNSRSVRINAPSESFKMMVDNNGIVTGYYSATQFTGKPLDEVVGKEMAAKIMEATEPKEFSGLDLQVGGEGMKGFYDNILPKSLDKLGKKFGAKVGKTEMDGVEVWQMDITPQMRESVTTKGQPLFAIPAIGAGLLGAGMMQEEEQF